MTESANRGPASARGRGGNARRFWLLAALLLGSILAWPGAGVRVALAQGSASADEYTVEITVEQDGTLAITERLAMRFAGGSFTRGFTTIELDRVEDIRDITVGEPGRDYARAPGEREPNTYRVRRDGGQLVIEWWYPRTTDGTRTFVIRYRVDGALRIYPDGDQLYWAAIDADHGYPIRNAEVLVRLPAAVPDDQLRAEAYPVRRDAAVSRPDSTSVRVQARDLAPDEGLVVRVQFPHGLVSAAPPAWQAAADAEDWRQANLRPVLNFVMLLAALAALGLGLGAIAVRWISRGRDPGVQAGPPVLSAPPDDLPAPLVGTLVDEHADAHDVVAAVIDMANRGVLRITPQPATDGKPDDYLLERLPDPPTEPRPYERLLLSILFGNGTQTSLQSARDTFAAARSTVQASLHEEVARAGLFVEDPDRVRRRFQLYGTALCIVAVVGGILLGGWLSAYADLALLPFAALFVVGVALFVMSGRMPKRTRAGALAAQRWNAFRRHLAQEARGEVAAEEGQFAPYLPYAIAFGLDRTWIDRFAQVAAPAPDWYQPGPVIVVGGPPFGGWGHPGSGHYGGPGGPPMGPWASGGSPGGPSGPGGLGDVSDSLADMLSRASDTFAHGGGSDWSGGGGGDFGGWSGGGGGGSSGFD